MCKFARAYVCVSRVAECAQISKPRGAVPGSGVYIGVEIRPPSTSADDGFARVLPICAMLLSAPPAELHSQKCLRRGQPSCTSSPDGVERAGGRASEPASDRTNKSAGAASRRRRRRRASMWWVGCLLALLKVARLFRRPALLSLCRHCSTVPQDWDFCAREGQIPPIVLIVSRESCWPPPSPPLGRSMAYPVDIPPHHGAVRGSPQISTGSGRPGGELQRVREGGGHGSGQEVASVTSAHGLGAVSGRLCWDVVGFVMFGFYGQGVFFCLLFLLSSSPSRPTTPANPATAELLKSRSSPLPPSCKPTLLLQGRFWGRARPPQTCVSSRIARRGEHTHTRTASRGSVERRASKHQAASNNGDAQVPLAMRRWSSVPGMHF
jgi:hypothetical protein